MWQLDLDHVHATRKKEDGGRREDGGRDEGAKEDG